MVDKIVFLIKSNVFGKSMKNTYWHEEIILLEFTIKNILLKK